MHSGDRGDLEYYINMWVDRKALKFIGNKHQYQIHGFTLNFIITDVAYSRYV